MKKNLKHSILFILIVITLLLVVVMSLAASKPISQVVEKGISTPINPIINGKWSGLGMVLFSSQASYVDTLLANGFTELRIDIPDYQNPSWVDYSKATLPGIIAKGANVIWGVSSNNFNSANYTITTENWPNFRQAILDAAQWAQDNGVYEFQLGNEEEQHVWRHPTSMSRTNNVVTVTFAENHGFTNANGVTIWNGTPADYQQWLAAITVTGAKSFTYSSVGVNGTVANPSAFYIGNLMLPTLRANLKSVATEVQAIFTRGNISYTSTGTTDMGTWHSEGRGDIDILGFNVYSNLGNWQGDITNMISWWGADHTYITEFGPSSTSLDSYSPDESIQAAAVATMIDYIKTSGINRACFFTYKSDAYGALRDDGTYRLLWDKAFYIGPL